MLLQTEGIKCFLLPAWPKGRDVQMLPLCTHISRLLKNALTFRAKALRREEDIECVKEK